MIPFAELTIGTAIQPSREWLQAVADGCEGLRAVVDVCGRLRTLADVSARNLDRTHHQPSDPQSETVTITYIRIRERTQHDSSKVLRLPQKLGLIFGNAANVLRLRHKLTLDALRNVSMSRSAQRLHAKPQLQLALAPLTRKGFAASP